MAMRSIILFILIAFQGCNAFARGPISFSDPYHHNLASKLSAHLKDLGKYRHVALHSAASATEGIDAKTRFLESLDKPYDLNLRSQQRTRLLYDLIEEGSLPGGRSFENPGSQETFASTAPGIWRVIYAPHMTIMSGIFKGTFSVQYDLSGDGSMTSHAKYSFPLFNLWGYLSVSGTYGSVNNQVCRVDFDEAWVRTFEDDSNNEGPLPNIESVPNSIEKSLIRNIGKAMFIEPFAVFPISYLDDDLIVFDFELLGTRICARKETLPLDIEAQTG